MITDAWHPGWQARVDGVSAPVLRVNAHFRGVPLPAGASQVELRFEPRSFRIGAGLSVFGAVAFACLALFKFARGRSRIW